MTDEPTTTPMGDEQTDAQEAPVMEPMTPPAEETPAPAMPTEEPTQAPPAE